MGSCSKMMTSFSRSPSPGTSTPTSSRRALQAKLESGEGGRVLRRQRHCRGRREGSSAFAATPPPTTPRTSSMSASWPASRTGLHDWNPWLRGNGSRKRRASDLIGRGRQLSSAQRSPREGSRSPATSITLFRGFLRACKSQHIWLSPWTASVFINFPDQMFPGFQTNGCQSVVWRHAGEFP